jgi:hypothetical protein
MNADFQLAGESAFGDLAVHGGAGQTGAGQHSFKADNSFEVGHGMFFHSLAVIGTPVDQTLSLKISHASAFCVPVKAGALSASLGNERLRTARNEYGRLWTGALASYGRSKNMAERTIHLRMATKSDVAVAISVGNGRILCSIRRLPTLFCNPCVSHRCDVQGQITVDNCMASLDAEQSFVKRCPIEQKDCHISSDMFEVMDVNHEDQG